MTIFHGIPPCSNVQDDRFTVGRKAIRDLATRFNTRPVLDQNLTREKFTDKTSTSSLIHIHSHIECDKNENDPLKRYYLSFGTAVQPWTLTPKDVLESIHFPAGSHITMVACDGAQFRIGPGDELLGIVPALLCAGASSVISTLWKTADNVGATFTNGFYEAFEADGGMVDVARAFQRAVISMDEGEREPLYNWAGFVLHGYWKFGRDGMEIGKRSRLAEVEVR
ncbi:CHAT domain-containing protein [Trichophaea hybrida]|nr:CHAT domain-containing protein [Trichophaea hybrida]